MRKGHRTQSWWLCVDFQQVARSSQQAREPLRYFQSFGRPSQCRQSLHEKHFLVIAHSSRRWIYLCLDSLSPRTREYVFSGALSTYTPTIYGTTFWTDSAAPAGIQVNMARLAMPGSPNTNDPWIVSNCALDLDVKGQPLTWHGNKLPSRINYFSCKIIRCLGGESRTFHE